MELKQIKELMTAMERAGIKKLSVKETTGFELQLERHDEAPVPQTPAPHPMSFHPVYHHSGPFDTQHRFSSSSQPEKPPSAEGDATASQSEKTTGRFITSPMVGTFYTSPSPEDPAFVKVGDRVEENTVVCIIEAMKVMNEVKAGISGIIAEIYIDSAHPVEFGTKLFRIQ